MEFRLLIEERSKAFEIQKKSSINGSMSTLYALWL